MYLDHNANMFDNALTSSVDETRYCRGHKMYSSTIIDPCRCMKYTEHNAGIGQDARDREDVAIAEVAGVVANLNEKIHLLKQEILELKDCRTISVNFPASASEKNAPLGYQSENKRLVRPCGRNVLKRLPSFSIFKKKLRTNECDEYGCGAGPPIPHAYCIRTETKKINERREGNERIELPNNIEAIGEIGRESINTSSENCYYDDISFDEKLEKGQRRPGWDKSTYVEQEKSNKSMNTKCYGRRVRKRISRGVQTIPDKKRSSRGKRKIKNLFKFEWHSGRKHGKEIEDCCTAISAMSHTKLNNVDVIYKPRNKRKNTILGTKSDDIKFADKTDKKARKKPVRVNRNDMPKKMYNRKYDFSIEGTDIKIVRAGEENPRVLKKSGTETLPAKPPITGRKKRLKCKDDSAKSSENNEENLSSSEGAMEKREGSEFRKRATLEKKSHLTGKTGRINEIQKSNGSSNIVSNNEVKDTPAARAKTGQPVVSVRERENPVENGKKGTKGSSAFKSFTRSVQKHFATQRRSKEESENQKKNDIVPRSDEPVSRRLDAKRNDIAEVKKRLDVCIADLNNIISNLSKVFQRDPAPGSGPAGEGTPENINFTPRGRSRLR